MVSTRTWVCGRGFDPLGGLHAVCPGHAQVHQDHVRSELSGEVHGLRAGFGLPDDFQIRLAREHAPQTAAHDGMVVGDQQPDALVTALACVLCQWGFLTLRRLAQAA